MTIAGRTLLVETAVLAGTEQTSALGTAGGKVVDAFEEAKDAIVAIGESVVDVIGLLGANTSRPSALEVEFGIGFTAAGHVLVAGVSGSATLRVKLVYATTSSGAAPNRTHASEPVSGTTPEAK
jgi:hypothetical protein